MHTAVEGVIDFFFFPFFLPLLSLPDFFFFFLKVEMAHRVKKILMTKTVNKEPIFVAYRVEGGGVGCGDYILILSTANEGRLIRNKQGEDIYRALLLCVGGSFFSSPPQIWQCIVGEKRKRNKKQVPSVLEEGLFVLAVPK